MKEKSWQDNFPQNTVSFLKKLSRNNSREWFEKNRELYNSAFLEPAVNFIVEMGEKLLTLSPNINAIPKIDKSIFRIYRDVRFSKNKAPYKTNMGLYFWEGKGKKMEGSGYYFHLEPKNFGAGAGMYQFTKEHLKKYRDIISIPERGKELDSIVKKIIKKGSYNVGGKIFKKTPRGYDPNSKYTEYLLHDGLYAWYDGKDFSELMNGNAVNLIFKKFKEMSLLHDWLVQNIIK
ncbi:DUF2461 domain-containing protein [bacterium BMS3Abin03]|jgi:uncharacterized protein (TIGR02453 family)|nr:DUF2461 domain-containing protein [bacterium BMS3Abin03]